MIKVLRAVAVLVAATVRSDRSWGCGIESDDYHI
jgi:hypothetical protein